MRMGVISARDSEANTPRDVWSVDINIDLQNGQS